MHVAFVTLALVLSAAAVPRPLGRRAPFTQKNGEDAIALNNKFKGLKADSPCQAGENACVTDQFAQCVGGKFVLQPCAGGTICAALPLVNSAGTSITCTTAADRDARIAATGANAGGGAAPANPPPANTPPPANPPPAQGGGQNNGGQNNAGGGGAAGGNEDPQKSTTLDPRLIQKTSQNDGTQLDGGAGAVPSIVSPNNFINFCSNFIGNTPVTDGKQVETGSCNPTPMGQIPAKANMPHSKFKFPANFAKVEAGKAFNIEMTIANIQTGFFTNAKNNYYSGPQQLNDQGQIKGHSHVVVQQIESFESTALVDPTKFVFFLGLNNPAANGVLTAPVDKGLPAGFYRLASINAAANHQPVLAPVAQHGSLDDIVYFEVTAAGGAAGGAAAPAPPAKANVKANNAKTDNKKKN